MVDQSGKSGVTFNMISAHSNFSEDIQIERMVDRSGKPDERNSSKHKDRRLSRNIAKKSVITNSKHPTQKKSADSYKDNYGDRNGNFVKLINKVLQKWKNYGNSRVLPSIRSRDENLLRIRTLFWKDFQDAESVRNGHSHVTSRPVSFPPHPVPAKMLNRSIKNPSSKDGPPSIWDTHGISGKRFCKSRCVFFVTLSARIASMEFINRRAAPLVHSGKK